MEYSEVFGEANHCKFAPDSSYFINYDTSNKLYIRDCSIQLKHSRSITTPNSISQARISSNSQYIAIFMNKKSLIHVYKAENCSLVAKIEDTQAGIADVYWVVNSMQLMVFSEYLYKVSVYNLMEGNMCYIKSPKFSTNKGFSFSSDGKFMSLIQKHECKDYLTVYYTRDWKVVNTYSLDLFDAVEVKWSPNNAYLTVWDNSINYRLIVFSHMHGQVLRYEPYNFALGIKAVKFSNNSLFLAVGSFDEKIRLLNAQTWQEIGILDCSNPTINCQKIMVLKQQEGNKNQNKGLKNVEQKFYKIQIVKPIWNEKANVLPQGVGLLQFSKDDNYIACKNENMPYTVWIWDVSTLEPITIITCANQIKQIKWTLNQNYLSIVSGTDRILFWKHKGTVAECIFKFQNKKMGITQMKWSNDGTKVLITDKKDAVYAELISETLLNSN